jgi:hypothetical protein
MGELVQTGPDVDGGIHGVKSNGSKEEIPSSFVSCKRGGETRSCTQTKTPEGKELATTSLVKLVGCNASYENLVVWLVTVTVKR